MKKRITLFRAKYSMLFFDCLGYMVGEDWKKMRRESAIFYKLIKQLLSDILTESKKLK